MARINKKQFHVWISPGAAAIIENIAEAEQKTPAEVRRQLIYEGLAKVKYRPYFEAQVTIAKLSNDN